MEFFISMNQRIGIGYDIHRLSFGRKLFLGGVDIPHLTGLQGHSDADVLLHAVCDALLGALGKGDIGEHFPNDDPQYMGISSLRLLEKVNEVLKSEGYKVVNVDVVVQAEEPNLKNYKAAMRANIAKILHLTANDVNVKATTMEGVGAIGNKEAIAAMATALIEKI